MSPYFEDVVHYIIIEQGKKIILILNKVIYGFINISEFEKYLYFSYFSYTSNSEVASSLSQPSLFNIILFYDRKNNK